MLKRKFINILMIFFALFTLASCSNSNNEVKEENKNPQQLQILNTGNTLTQEQMQSQIKADLLIKNNGYLPNDIVTVILNLNDQPLIKKYSNLISNKYKNVNEYIESYEGKCYLNSLNSKQNALIDKLNNQKLINSVLYRYTTVTNAIAVTLPYKNLEKVEGLSAVKYAILSETYNRVKETNDEDYSYDIVENLVDVYESTGIFNSSSVPYTGEGTAVAILDSGFDVSHEVFANQPQTEMIDINSINNVIKDLNAYEYTDDLKGTDVYYSKKIPFTYDYADKDPDVAPFDSSHGTHVAGIIGGSSSTITGVAVNTQLVLMKVFGDKDNGAESHDILAGLEDAVTLGVDCINMSLGTTCGFSREVDEYYINEVYDSIEEAGITCLAAASNDYSSGMNGPTGNTSLVTHPDSGTIGSPGSYDSTLTVASISGVKSRYVIGNGNQTFFFHESNQIDGTSNDFIKELFEYLNNTGEISKMDENGDITLEYVTVPGIGANVNYANVDVEGKIALVRRGSNTFEEKASIAKAYGAIACIIYNNIDGDIIMSMGKENHIPTVSISKDDGTVLASKDFGTMTFNQKYLAGPFMSDFSSWGPTPDLKLKPEITGHGGNIVSAIPGGGYDKMSGTSMATPNLCGVTVLIRQYLKEKYEAELETGEMTVKDINRMANQLLMSTATIAKDENGNSYSPRKQGAGLASLKKATTTNAFISVDGLDKSKLELGDDINRTGVYEMTFNVENISSHSIKYILNVDALTESVSTSDYTHLAEKAQKLNGTTNIEIINGVLVGNEITVPANEKATITVTYTLSSADKKMMDSSFPYGIYVEGYVALEAVDKEEVDVNVPFLAFYGDWSQAPILDKTFFEVQSEEYNDAIDPEDKIAADYYATTPFASYMYSYIISMGTYIYDIPSGYDMIPATEEHIAISDTLGTLDGISGIYAGLLRGCKEIDYTITDNVTGQIIYEFIDYNGRKSATSSGVKTPYIHYFYLKAKELSLVNNRTYTFNMECKLDYKNDGTDTNIRNNFSYTFTFDNEAPIIKNATYETVYDKALKKNRYYVNIDVYDNHYTQCITPLSFTLTDEGELSYSILSPNPIPVYGDRATTNNVKIEITDYIEDQGFAAAFKSGIPVQVTDYALNSTIYLLQLPGTNPGLNGEFKFTADGTENAKELGILGIKEGEYLDLTQYLYSSDLNDDPYFYQNLIWSSSNTNIAEVKNGVVVGLKPGRTTITVTEPVYEGTEQEIKASIKIDVEANETKSIKNAQNLANSSGSIDDATIESLRFVYFDTLYAHAECSDRSIIGKTGDRVFINSLMDGLSFYPGEEIQLFYDFDPWYAQDNYEYTWASSNPLVASVDEFGVVKGLKKGNTIITLSVNGSNIKARIDLTINSEFVIEDKTLVAYKGLGGDVVIPDDEGIIAISQFAFSLYTIDKNMEINDRDYDANKIPSTNNTITSITVPKGVTDIQKYAFYSCKALKKVTLSESVKNIYEYAFAECESLEYVNLENVSILGKYCFMNCTSLNNIDLSHIYGVGMGCFLNATSLEFADLSSLRNNSEYSFENTTGLKEIIINKNTKLSYGMFKNSGIESVTLDMDRIPEECFKDCKNLRTVTFNNTDMIYIGSHAFSGNTSLLEVKFNGSLRFIYDSAFSNCTSLSNVTLPNSNVILGDSVFAGASSLTKLIFNENTYLSEVGNFVFNNTNISEIELLNNAIYSISDGLLLNGKEIVLALAQISGDYSLPNNIESVAASSFTGCNDLTSIIINNNLIIKNGAFSGLSKLESLEINGDIIVNIEASAFRNSSLKNITGSLAIKNIGDYAFSNIKLQNMTFSDDITIGFGAFKDNKELTIITFGKNTKVGEYAFENCSLASINMPDEISVYASNYAFMNNKELNNIDISKINYIGNHSFENCVKLTTASIKAEYVGDYAFSGCKMLSSVDFENTKYIGHHAFYFDYNGSSLIKNSVLSNVILSDTLLSIGDYAFGGCVSLNTIIIPNNVMKIGQGAFINCIALANVTLSDDLDAILDYTFYNCSKLTSIDTKNVETIGFAAFAGCSLLNDANLEYVCYIEDYAFQGAILINLQNTSNVEYIGAYAFSGNQFSEFDSASVTYIGEGAFYNCKKLTLFSFNKDIKNVSSSAFYGAQALTTFKYDGKTTAVINDYAYLKDGILYTYLPNGKKLLSSVPAALNITTLNIDEDTYRIDSFAGNANKYISTIVIPDGTNNIGAFAFYGYSKLDTVIFNTSIAPTLENIYDTNSELNTDAPGADLLYNIPCFFPINLSYYNFKALAGSMNPIGIKIPTNTELYNYDSLPYELFFGSIYNENGEINKSLQTEYEAMDKDTVEYLAAIALVPDVSELKYRDKDVVMNALICLNKLKQNLEDFGYTADEILYMSGNLLKCKDEIQRLKLEYASTNVQNIQKAIDELGTEFSIDKLATLLDLNNQINNLSRDDKEILDMTGYKELQASYEAYRKQLEIEANQSEQIVNNLFCVAVISIIATSSILGCAIIILKKKIF